MIPKGAIYYQIRTKVLEAYPKGCKASTLNTNRLTFANWLLNGKGSYFVKSIDKKEIIISTTQVDISSSLLTDIESLFNHCFEHLQEMACYYDDSRPRSDAWSVVTIYYFSFFTAQIFLRLIGQPTIFISPQQIDNIKGLSLSTSSGIGSGAFRLEQLIVNHEVPTDYKLKKSNNSKIHEATWIDLFTYLKVTSTAQAKSTSPEETLFYSNLTTSVLNNIYDGYGWPSVIRTIANYRAGFAYLSIDKGIIAKTKGTIGQWRHFDSDKINDLLSKSSAACAPGDKSEFSHHVKLLFDISQSIFLLCRELYSEVLDRVDISRVWEMQRADFCKNMAFPKNEFVELTKTYLKPNSK